MGKNKYTKYKEKTDSDNDEWGIMEIVAEKLGKPMWSVTQADIDDYKMENADNESSSDRRNDDEEDDEEEELEDEKDQPQANMISNAEITNPGKTEEVASTEEKKEKSKYPIITKISSEITCYTEEVTYQEEETFLDNQDIMYPKNIILHEEDMEKEKEKEKEKEINSWDYSKHIKFLPVKNVFEYPRELKIETPPPEPKKKPEKKDKKMYEDNSDAKAKKNKKNVKKEKDNDDWDEDEMKRLEEIRRQREEYAYWAQLKKEDDEKRKKEMEDAKLNAAPKKIFKPKNKKKRK